MSTTDNPSSAIERHTWLAWVTPEQRNHALHGLYDPMWADVYRSEFAVIGVSELLAAVDDPELPGLYVPPPKDPERFITQIEARWNRKFPLPDGCTIERHARNLQLREAVNLAVTEEYLQAMTRRFSTEEVFVELNHNYHFVQNVGGKVRVVWWEKVDGKVVLQMQSIPEFRQAHRNWKVVDEDFNAKTGKWSYTAHAAVDIWLDSPKRPSKARLVFRPEQEVAPDELNLWHGYAVKPDPEGGLDKIDLFLDFLHKVICAGDDELTDYVWNWMANAVQNPHKPGETALVLQSDEHGTGKGFFARKFGHLFGRHFLQSANAKHIVGDFNSHLRYCVLLFADEAFFAGDRRQANSLKGLITEPTIMVEGKGIDSEPSANCIHLIMASNEAHVARVEEHDRRLCILQVSPIWAGRQDLFDQMEADLEDGGYEQLLAALLSVDLTNWRPQPVPNTVAKEQQKLMTSGDTWDDAIARLIDDAVAAQLDIEKALPPQIRESDKDGKLNDARNDAIAALVAAQGVRVHTETLLNLLDIPIDRQDQRSQERLASVMRRKGWQQPPGGNVRIKGRVAKGWRRPGTGQDVWISRVAGVTEHGRLQ